jgi:hypothetical protein
MAASGLCEAALVRQDAALNPAAIPKERLVDGGLEA